MSTKYAIKACEGLYFTGPGKKGTPNVEEAKKYDYFDEAAGAAMHVLPHPGNILIIVEVDDDGRTSYAGVAA